MYYKLYVLLYVTYSIIVQICKTSKRIIIILFSTIYENFTLLKQFYFVERTLFNKQQV